MFGLIKYIRELIYKWNCRKCLLCGNTRQLRFVENVGKICFPCFKASKMNRAERRRFERYVNQ